MVIKGKSLVLDLRASLGITQMLSRNTGMKGDIIGTGVKDLAPLSDRTSLKQELPSVEQAETKKEAGLNKKIKQRESHRRIHNNGRFILLFFNCQAL